MEAMKFLAGMLNQYVMRLFMKFSKLGFAILGTVLFVPSLVVASTIDIQPKPSLAIEVDNQRLDDASSLDFTSLAVLPLPDSQRTA